MNQSSQTIHLPERGLIKISGKDRKSFLQSLITNDINKLSLEPLLYSCLLTPNGKFLHDFFIFEQGETLYIDCEGQERAQDLSNRLNIYKLRSKVEIETLENTRVLALISPEAENKDFIFQDPRHKDMGYRIYNQEQNNLDFEFDPETFKIWDKHRISLTIPDGSRDLIVEKSTMDEGNMDQINAICYEKGCYIGQELTARMHYRGLGKKKLKTVSLDNIPERAELRSSCEDIGIALVRI